MLSNQVEKQALRYNAIVFYGGFIFAVIFAFLAVIFAVVTVYILARALPIHGSIFSSLLWPSFLPLGVPPVLSGGFVYGSIRASIRFWTEAQRWVDRQAALELWDSERANDRVKKDAASAESTARDQSKIPVRPAFDCHSFSIYTDQ